MLDIVVDGVGAGTAWVPPSSTNVSYDVGTGLANEATASLSVTQEADTISATGFVFPIADLLGIAGDLRSFVPVIRQLVEAQAKLTENMAEYFTRLSADAARIAELTATNLEKEARSGHPDLQVVEHCLRVGAWLLREVVAFIRAAGYTIATEYLLHPDDTAARIVTVAVTIEHVLAKWFS